MTWQEANLSFILICAIYVCGGAIRHVKWGCCPTLRNSYVWTRHQAVRVLSAGYFPPNPFECIAASKRVASVGQGASFNLQVEPVGFSLCDSCWDSPACVSHYWHAFLSNSEELCQCRGQCSLHLFIHRLPKSEPECNPPGLEVAVLCTPRPCSVPTVAWICVCVTCLIVQYNDRWKKNKERKKLQP